MQSTIQEQPTLVRLAGELRAAKAAEEAARQARIKVEEAILAHVKGDLKPEGTHTFDTVKIVTKLSRSWDQERLAQISKEVEPAWFPFKTEYKEDRKAARVVEERFPDLWGIVSDALTLKPAKPTVTLIEEE